MIPPNVPPGRSIITVNIPGHSDFKCRSDWIIHKAEERIREKYGLHYGTIELNGVATDSDQTFAGEMQNDGGYELTFTFVNGEKGTIISSRTPSSGDLRQLQMSTFPQPHQVGIASHIGAALPRLPPVSIPPEYLNGNKLYEREAASKQLFGVLFHSLGTRKTAFCDYGFGAGKTSLIWKFRSILSELPDWKWPEGSETLKNAIYVHVRFSNHLTPNHLVDFQNPEDIDRILLRTLATVFSRSLHAILNPASVQDLIDEIRFRSNGSIFLIHMDEVGVFESFPHGKNAICRMWHLGESLHNGGGHYYVLTGRSAHLYTIGTLIPRRNPGSFSLLHLAELVPLPLLSRESVGAMLLSFNLKPDIFNETEREEMIDHIHAFTCGVPRAVYAAVMYCVSNNRPSFCEVEEFVVKECQCFPPNEGDRTLFYYCLELSWDQITLTNDIMILEQPITAVIARLGIYRDYVTSESFT